MPSLDNPSNKFVFVDGGAGAVGGGGALTKLGALVGFE